MHEYSLAVSLSETIVQYAGDKKVIGMRIGLGQFSGVNRDTFEFCSDAVFKEQFGRDLKIEIEDVRGKLLCVCGHVYESDDLLIGCPECNGYEREIIEGKDLTLISIQVDDESSE